MLIFVDLCKSNFVFVNISEWKYWNKATLSSGGPTKLWLDRSHSAVTANFLKKWHWKGLQALETPKTFCHWHRVSWMQPFDPTAAYYRDLVVATLPHFCQLKTSCYELAQSSPFSATFSLSVSGLLELELELESPPPVVRLRLRAPGWYSWIAGRSWCGRKKKVTWRLMKKKDDVPQYVPLSGLKQDLLMIFSLWVN